MAQTDRTRPAHRTRLAGVASLVLLTGLSAAGDNWPQWRGPQANGVALTDDFPVAWSRTKNVLWKVELAGEGASTPAVWDDSIFLTQPIDGQNGVLCLGRDGRERWSTVLGRERAGQHRKATSANSSPVTDGVHVFVYFKSGDLACLDFDGQIVWQTNLQQTYGEDTLWWDLGTSPVLTNNHVVVACVQSGPSHVVAFDKNTGAEAWKVDRTFDTAEESDNSYTTPVVVGEPGAELVIVAGADHVTAHDASTGERVWLVDGLNPSRAGLQRSIASPVAASDAVVVPYRRGETLTSVRLGGTGDVTATHVNWTIGASADVPTPVVADDRIYVCDDNGAVSCVDVASGDVLWSQRVGKSRTAISASPVLAGGRVYLTRENGTTLVIDAAGDHELLATNKLDETTIASPVFVDGRILIRTAEHLWCIGQ